MKNPKRYSLPFKRKKLGLTNYRKRLRLLTSGEVRLVVRVTLNNIQASIVEYAEKGDAIKLSVHSSSLSKYGWKADTGNIPSAYLVGFVLGKKAQAAGIKKAILDIGMKTSIKNTRLYAVVAGALEAGLDVPHGGDNLPPEERLTGTHIAEYAKTLKENPDEYQKKFSRYLKRDLHPEQLPDHVKQVKDTITKA